MNKNDEQILALNKSALEKINLIQDMLNVEVLAPTNLEDYDAMVNTLNNLWEIAGVVGRRGDLEENFDFVQPIPYTIIAQGDKYFTYTRLEGSGESRLHGKSSIGIGGHQNEVEHAWNFEHILAVNSSRELEEEVTIKTDNGIEITNHYEITKESAIIGLLYNEKTEVDSVHLGVLNVIVIPENWTVESKETDTLEGSFKTKEEIEKLDLENWSKSALTILT